MHDRGTGPAFKAAVQCQPAQTRMGDSVLWPPVRITSRVPGAIGSLFRSV